jgi:hypothetical protein
MTVLVPTEPLQLTTSDLRGRLDQVLGRSSWHRIEQADANAFGAATHDEQWIHTDPARAASGPFGRTIAHGYLTLSLATALLDEILEITDAVMVVNYGLDRVRFPRAASAGCRDSRGGRPHRTSRLRRRRPGDTAPGVRSRRPGEAVLRR